MRKNLVMLSSYLIASALFSFSQVKAQEIELHRGWNFVALNYRPVSEGTARVQNFREVETVTAFGYVEDPFNPGHYVLSPLTVNSFQPGQGYWIKSSSDTTIDIPTTNEVVTPTLHAGWNMVGLVSDFSSLETRGYKIETVTAFGYVEDPFNPGHYVLSPLTVNSFQPGQGYWVKVKKQVGEVTTSEGVILRFFADSESVSIDTSQLTGSSISNILTNLPSDYSGSIDVVTIDGNTHEESTVYTISVVNGNPTNPPSDEQIQSIVSGTTVQLQNPVVYVYGIAPGSAPQVLSGAEVYKITDNDTELLGTTDGRGFISLEGVEAGDEILVQFPGYVAYRLRIEGNQVYYAVLSTGTSTVEEYTTSNSTISSDTLTSQRILLDAAPSRWKILRNLVYHLNEYTVRRSFRLASTVGTRISYQDELERVVETENQEYPVSAVVAGVDFVLKSGLTGRVLPIDKAKFSELFVRDETHSSDVDRFYIGVPRGNAGQYEFNGIPIEDIIARSGGTNPTAKLELWCYKPDASGNLRWQKIGDVSVDPTDTRAVATLLRVNDITGTIRGEESAVRRIGSDYVIRINNVGINQSYDGFYPLAVVYRERQVSQINVTLNIKDTEGNPVPNALVTIGDRTYTTDDNGIVSATLSMTAAGATIPVTVTHPDYYREFISITPSMEDTSISQDITLTPIPQTALITGRVIDQSNGEAVTNAKVTLINPISLDRAVVTNRDGFDGIEVGLDSFAKYTWYVRKKPSSTYPDTTTNERIFGGLGFLPRVSEQAWIEVKSGQGRDGNFVSFKEVIAKLLEAKKQTDPDIVLEDISGTFEIAVKVEHDIDGDGNPDYTELAVSDNLTDVVNDETGSIDQLSADKIYGRKIGEFKVTISERKLLESTSSAAPSNEVAIKVDLANGTTIQLETDENGDIIQPQNMSFDELDILLNSIGWREGAINLYGGYNPRASEYPSPFSITVDTSMLGNSFSIDWNVELVADLKDVDNNTVATVALTKVGDTYKWKLIGNNENGDPLTLEDLFSIGDFVEYLYGNEEFWVAKAGRYALENGTVTAPDNVVTFRRLIRTISEDGIIKALHRNVSEVAEEAGISSNNLRNADKDIVFDGVSVVLVPVLRYTTSNNDRVTAVFHIEGLTLQADSADELLDISDIAVAPVAEVPSEATYYTSDVSDRRGTYRFEVPFMFGNMNGELSFVRLSAERFDYYPSGYVNVPAFEHEDYQRTVRNVDISLRPKVTHSLTIDLRVNGDDSPSATAGTQITVTGVRSANGGQVTYTVGENGTLTYRYIPGLNGQLPTIPDILEGRQQVIISKEGYEPYVTTVQMDEDKTITVNLTPVRQAGDYQPQISIGSYYVDYDRGVGIITGVVMDRDNETDVVSDTISISTLVNGDNVRSQVQIDEATGEFVIGVPLQSGISSVILVATNDKGATFAEPVYFEYYPNIGSINGRVEGCNLDEGEGFVATLYDENFNPVDSVIPDAETREFRFISVPTGHYTLQGICYSLSGVPYYATPQQIEVEAGHRTDITLSVNRTEEAVTGSPRVVWDNPTLPPGTEYSPGEITIPEFVTSGTIQLHAILENFDGSNDVERRLAIVVNDTPIPLGTSYLTLEDQENHRYRLDYSLSLDRLAPGTNTVYVVAVNRNGEFDFSDDLYIFREVADDQRKRVDLEFVLSNGESVRDDYVYVNVYREGELVAHKVSNDNGTNNYVEMELLPGTYEIEIYTQNGNYLSISGTLEVEEDGSIILNGAGLVDRDGDGYQEVTLSRMEYGLNLPPAVEVQPQSLTIREGENATVEVRAFDPEGDELSYSVEVADQNIVNATVEDNSIRIQGLAVGQTTVKVTVREVDNGENSANATIYVEVVPNVNIEFPPASPGYSTNGTLNIESTPGE
ncbi:PEGA domain-containing protein [Desulfurobacterium crinifex]